ncbi:hypothetical protein [Aquitalea sp. USM4]|uniref:hypothetical protein n=1 Tax=Aquitalea sp. USM4 TaxID=1590041 RepID=UPI001040614C|nr:hypothetical protein [Aquitalea sp. USM4]
MYSEIDYQGKPLIEYDKQTIVALFQQYVVTSRKQMDDQMARDRRQMLAAYKSRNEPCKETFMSFVIGALVGASIATIALCLVRI